MSDDETSHHLRESRSTRQEMGNVNKGGVAQGGDDSVVVDGRPEDVDHKNDDGNNDVDSDSDPSIEVLYVLRPAGETAEEAIEISSTDDEDEHRNRPQQAHFGSRFSQLANSPSPQRNGRLSMHRSPLQRSGLITRGLTSFSLRRVIQSPQSRHRGSAARRAASRAPARPMPKIRKGLRKLKSEHESSPMPLGRRDSRSRVSQRVMQRKLPNHSAPSIGAPKEDGVSDDDSAVDIHQEVDSLCRRMITTEKQPKPCLSSDDDDSAKSGATGVCDGSNEGDVVWLVDSEEDELQTSSEGDITSGVSKSTDLFDRECGASERAQPANFPLTRENVSSFQEQNVPSLELKESRRDQKVLAAETNVELKGVPDSAEAVAIQEEGFTVSSSPTTIAWRRRARVNDEYNEAIVKLQAEADLEVDMISSVTENDNTYLMHGLPSLCGTTFDAENKPRRRFSVTMGCDDSIIYDFEIAIRKSCVAKNAGWGAFLRYRGSRRLRDPLYEINFQKLKSRVPVDPGTLEPLHAQLIDGSGVMVSLTGKHLHGHNNSIWRTQTELPIEAVPFDGTEVSVILSGQNLHYDSDEDEPLDHLSCCPKRIGNLGVNVESDYVPFDEQDFVPENGQTLLLDIGRYGPARRDDRKRKHDFDTKSFLFDGEPSGWNFGVDELHLGYEQIVDVTDDATGETHSDAARLGMIFVNEVGHNDALIENVRSCQTGSNIITYYAEVKTMMRKGEEVELLTNYFDRYEGTRERKGYGRNNLLGKCKSDHDLASKLQRNFEERFEIKEMIYRFKLIEIFYAVEFVAERIVPPVVKATSTCFTHKAVQTTNKSVIPTPRQLRARLRMRWLSQVYLARVNQLMGQEPKASDELGRETAAEMLHQCQVWIDSMTWTDLPWKSTLTGCSNRDFQGVFEYEILEEMLYYARDRLPFPMDLNLWCPIARDLTVVLCRSTFQLFGDRPYDIHALSESFKESALVAARSIRTAVKEREYSRLEFLSGAEGDTRVKGSAKNLAILSAGPTLSHSFALKGAISALLDIQACIDLNELGFENYFDLSHLEYNCDGPVMIVKTNHGGCHGLPRRAELFKNGFLELNVEWYLVWQIVYPAYILFTALVEEFGDKDRVQHAIEKQFLNDICRAVGIDVEEARVVVDVGFRKDLASPNVRFISNLEKEQQKQKSRNAKMKKMFQKTEKSNKKGMKKETKKTARKAKQTIKKTRVNSGVDKPKKHRQYFFDVVWKTLTGLGWTLVVGTRPTDFYFLPPGVQRGRGFSNRVDFFDSYRLVVTFLKTDPRWKDEEQVKEAIAIYEGCQKFLKLRKIRGQVTGEWVIEQVRLTLGLFPSKSDAKELVPAQA